MNGPCSLNVCLIVRGQAVRARGPPERQVRLGNEKDRVVAEMTAAVREVGGTYTAPDGVAYTLTDSAQLDVPAPDDTLALVGPPQTAPIVEEVLRFEGLPVGSSATRAAFVRWSDGTESQALAWYSDEILICEGDHGNSRLMSSRVEMRGVAGSIAARRAHNLSASTSCRASLVIVGAALDGGS